MSIIAFVLFAWTAATWFSVPYGKPFLGLPIFSVNPLIPLAITLLWSLGSGLHWLIRRRGAMRIRMDLEKLLKEQRTGTAISGTALSWDSFPLPIPRRFISLSPVLSSCLPRISFFLSANRAG